jgi:hypothetical protein
MRPTIIFRIIVQTLGLIVFLLGLESILEGILMTMGLSRMDYVTAKYFGLKGVVQVVAGLMIMRGAVPLMQIAYPESEDHDSPPGSADHNPPSQVHQGEPPNSAPPSR